ncbi:hypothetical protein AMS68_001965 [Peltaster fructicola]|uniref:Nucleoporin NUP188 n=1 Tax=Peltaster fructicola TaxID=286661 RepID=A0A6H0XP93_9PEZI|nr:hypothetical protein AMS68_001965 [Peltaster fructicola]
MAYFPPLDRCLSGKEPLISWHSILNELTSDPYASDQVEIQAFLSDSEAITILSQTSRPFDRQNEETKRAWQDKTAPIHVSSIATAGYSINQLKIDSLWLAKELDISELAALRVIIIEWQSRPADLLLGRTSDSTSQGTATVREVARHRRLLQVYLQETSAIKHISAILVALDTGEAASGDAEYDPWMLRVRDSIRRIHKSIGNSDNIVSAFIKEFERLTSMLENNRQWPECFQNDFILHADYSTAVLRDMTSTLRQGLVYLFHTADVSSAATVLSWFQTMQRTTFLQELAPPTPEQATLVDILQCLVSVFSAALLALPKAIHEVDQISGRGPGSAAYPDLGQKPYIADDDCVRQLNLIMFEIAETESIIAGPALYTWSILTMVIRDLARMEQEVLQQIEDSIESSGRHGGVTRRSSLIEQKYDVLQDRSLGAARDDPPQYLARHAADDLNVFAIIADLSRIMTSTYAIALELPIAQISRAVLFNVVRESLPTVTYDEHVLEAVLALLAPDSAPQARYSKYPSLAASFWRDRERWFPAVFQEALSRYPYEISPLLRLLSALVGNITQSADDWSSVVEGFESLSTLTMTLPEGFRGYTLEHEEDGVNAFRLLEDLPIFVDHALQGLEYTNADSSALQTDERAALMIPAGTHGTIRKDQRPFVVSLRHSYSGLHYIGLLLMTLLPNTQYTLSPPAPPTDNFVAADIMQLIVNLLRGASDRPSAQHILEELSTCIPGGLDIIAVIGETLETALLARAEQSSQPGSNELIVQCIRFFAMVTPYFPERLWSYLAQGGLLGTNDGRSTLLATVGASEDETQRSQLLSECLELYRTAVDDAIHGLVRRRKPADAARLGSRFDSPVQSSGEISERVITQTLTTFTALALQVLQAIGQAGAHFSVEKSTTVKNITSTFIRLLTVVYGIGDSSAIDAGLAKVVAPSAQLVLTTLLPDDLSLQAMSPLLSTMTPIIHADVRVVASGQKTLFVGEARSVLNLICVLLRTARLLSKPSAKLNTALISGMHVFTSLFALQAPFQKVVAELLTEMVAALHNDEANAESIFSQLSQQQGTHFLDLLTRFDSSLTDAAAETKVWDLFAAACKHGQQWFAMYLMTAVLPKDQIKDQAKPKKTALSQALDLLSDMKNLNPNRASSILRFVAEAQKSWTWVTSIVREHPDFLTSALNWLQNLKPYTPSANVAQQLLAAREYRLAAALCDVLAVNVHTSLELGDKKLSQDIAAKADFLTSHAAKVDGYNSKLHPMLADNLSNRFAGFNLADLKRTAVNPGTFGNDYMYDLDIGKVVLGHDGSWQGHQKTASQGFADEVARANVNWSLYNAQIDLLERWKTLAITLADGDGKDEKLAQIMTSAARSCLMASVNTTANDPETASLQQTRADLVFALLSKLIKTPCDINRKDNTTQDPAGQSSILEAAWELVRTSPVDYSVAEATEDLTYYRTLLQVLFLALQLDNRSQAAQLAASRTASQNGTSNALVRLNYAHELTLVDIMSRTIAPGFRALCGNLHESTDCARPDDFALLIALAKAVLSGGCSKQFHDQIADAVAFSAIIRSAASLYSWSDRLAEFTANDPVYGELAIMFLLTLSRVPQVAEQMAVENILSQISSANLSEYLRKPGGKGPFDEPARMFVIWTDGLLPLCLNLIEAVGPPIVPEISSFFSSFPQQLARAEKALQNASPSTMNPTAGAVTLGLVNEARDLITIAQILKATIGLSAADGIAVEDVQDLNYNISLIGEDLEAMTKSQRSLRDRVTPVTARELALYNDKSGGNTDDALQGAIIRAIDHSLALLKE